MGLSMRELMTLDIVARDEASPTIEKVSAASKAATVENGLAYKQASIRALTYSKVLRGVSKGLTLYGGAAVAVSAIAGKEAVDFQKQMGLVRTQTDLTDKQFKQLEASVLELASKTSRPISELTSGLYDIFSSGLKVSGPQVIKMLGAISKAAVAGDTDIRTVSRTALSEMNAFGIGAGGVNKILDQQFQLLRFSQGTYDELVSSLGNVISSAHQAGQSLTEMNAAIGFLTQRGMSFSMASISVARAMDFLTRPEIAQKLKTQLGVNIVDAQGNFKKLSVIMTDIGNKLAGKTLPQIKKALSDVWGNGEIRANRFFNSVIPNIEAYNKNLKQTSKYHGALTTAYDKLKNTTSVLWGKMLNNLKKIAIEFGDTILPAIDKVIAAVEKIFNWIAKLPAPVKNTIGQFVIWSGIIALILSRVTKLAAGFLGIVSMRLWSGMAAGADGAAVSIGKLGSTVFSTLGKFTLWGGVIAGLAILFVKNFGAVKKWFEGFIGWWQDHWKQIWNNIKPILVFVGQEFMKVLKIVAQVLGSVIGWIGKFVAKMLTIKPVVQGIVVFLLTAIGVKLVEGIVSALATIGAAFARFGAALLASARANWVMLLVAALVTAAYLIIKNWAKVKDFFSKVFNGIARDAAYAANFFIRYFINPIITGINAIIQALNDISPFKDISKIAPVRAVQIPAKYTSNVGNAAADTNKAADATKALSGAASGATANMSDLDKAIRNYNDGAGKTDTKTKGLTKSIRDIQKAIATQVQAVNKGKTGFFSLSQAANNLMSGPFGNGKISNAARVQAGALRQAVAAQERNLGSMLKNVTGGKQLAAALADMGDQSLKVKQRFAQLFSVTSALGIKLNKAQLATVKSDVNTHNLADANKVLSQAIKNVNDQLGRTEGKKPTVKINVDTKQADQNIKNVQDNLKSVDKKTVWATINAHDEPINNVLKKTNSDLEAVNKKTVWATINAHDEPATKAISNVNSELNTLARKSVSIPINVSTTTDPYAYGYALGQRVAAGARAALQQKSPSKVFIKIGQNVIKGLVIGLRHAGLLKQLDNSVQHITDIVKQMPAELTNTFRLLSQGTSKALNDATNGFDKFMGQIDNLKNKIGDLKDAIKSHIKDITGKINDLNKAISDKSTKAAEKAADILKKSALQDQLKKWMDVSNLPNKLSGVARKLTSWGNDLQHQMKALNARVQSFTSDFRQGFQQGTDIVSILGGETDRKNINVRKFFRDKITEAKKWASVLKQLAHKGLNPALLQELAAAGPDALPLAQEILQTGVKFVNHQQSVLNQIMGQTQKYLVNTVFGDQIDKLAKEAKAFRDALQKLVDAIKRATQQTSNNSQNNGGGGGGNFEYHYHAPPRADTKAQVRELSWWWRTHRWGR